MTPLTRALALVLATGACGLGAAHADDEYDTGMQRVKTCSLQASAQKLTGDARERFLSGCWAAARKTDRLRACDMEASNRHLAGDAREGFLSDCLKER